MVRWGIGGDDDGVRTRLVVGSTGPCNPCRPLFAQDTKQKNKAVSRGFWSMLDRLRRVVFPPDEYCLIQQKPDRRVIDRLDEPVTVLEAQERYGLEDGRFVLQEIHGGQFGRKVWVEEFGDPQRARDLDELRREVAGLRGEIESEPSKDPMEEVPAATMQAVLTGQLGVQEARAVADLHQAFTSGHSPPGLAETVEDPGDISEVGGRALLNLVDNPERLQEFSEAAGSALGSAAVGAMQAQQHPQHQPPQQAQAPPTPSAPGPGPGAAPEAEQAAADGGAVDAAAPSRMDKWRDRVDGDDTNEDDVDQDGVDAEAEGEEEVTADAA